jgi:hypothetical protein
MGVKDFIKEGMQEIDEDSDPALARRRAEERPRQTQDPQTPESQPREAPKTTEMPGPSG